MPEEVSEASIWQITLSDEARHKEALAAALAARGTKYYVEQKLQDRDAAGVHLYLLVDCVAGGIFMRSQGRTFAICQYVFESGVVGPATKPAEFSGVEWSCFFYDLNAIILMLNCELMGTIAWEDAPDTSRSGPFDNVVRC